MYSIGYITRLGAIPLPGVLIARSVPTGVRLWTMPVHAALSRCTSFFGRGWASGWRCIH